MFHYFFPKAWEFVPKREKTHEKKEGNHLMDSDLKNRHSIGFNNTKHLTMEAATINQLNSDKATDIMQSNMRDKLNRILEIDNQTATGEPSDNDLLNNKVMLLNIQVRPNPFMTSVTLDVGCEQSRHTIVRMMNKEGRIVKMFSWFLVKGINVTTINEVDTLEYGVYNLDMLDIEGNLLYSTEIVKEN